MSDIVVIETGAAPDVVIAEDTATEVTVETPAANVVVVEPPSGAPGPPGPPGPPGAAGGTGWVRVDVPVPNTAWIVPHPFHAYVNPQTFDSTDREIIGEVSYPDLDHVRIDFAVPVAGWVAVS